MPSLGFSTGALFKDALARGVEASALMRLEAIELSALRLRELDGLVDFVRTADLSGFTYVSLHAPTDYRADQESAVARTLLKLAVTYKWFVVVHPDVICNDAAWTPFGEWLCIENMDKRKASGRTVEELAQLFLRFPSARLCFDIAHAHQVDPSMTEAYRILREFRDRICQLHVSEVTSSSKHDRISNPVLEAFREVAEHLPRHVPVILETPVTLEEAPRELRQVATLFERVPVPRPVHA